MTQQNNDYISGVKNSYNYDTLPLEVNRTMTDSEQMITMAEVNENFFQATKIADIHGENYETI